MRCSRLSKLSSSSSCSCSTSMRRRTAPSHSSGSGSSLPRLRSLSSSADRLPEIVERVLEKLEREFVFVSVGILLVEEILPVLHEGGPMPMSRGGCVILGRRIRFSGRMVRYYLWAGPDRGRMAAERDLPRRRDGTDQTRLNLSCVLRIHHSAQRSNDPQCRFVAAPAPA
jgi:hypothetical protein